MSKHARRKVRPRASAPARSSPVKVKRSEFSGDQGRFTLAQERGAHRVEDERARGPVLEEHSKEEEAPDLRVVLAEGTRFAGAAELLRDETVVPGARGDAEIRPREDVAPCASEYLSTIGGTGCSSSGPVGLVAQPATTAASAAAAARRLARPPRAGFRGSVTQLP